MDIKDIKKELLTQDNRSTSIPIFLVQQKIRDYGFDSDYTNDYVWIGEDYEEADEIKAEQLNGYDEDCVGLDDNTTWNKTYYRDRWEFVQPFFTEKAAKKYIEENSHRLNEPKIYVESGHRNSEFEAIRNFILKL